MPRLAAVECVDNASIHEAMEQRVLPRAAHDIRFFADFAVERLAKPPRALPGDERNAVRRDPAGVAAVSTPWNASFMLATWRVGPALAAGCTVVLKPPEWAPLTCSLLGDLADATGKIAAYQSDNSGQVCLADTHLLVERSILDEFAERFRAQAAAIEVGDPRDAATTYGPLIHPVALELATGHVARAVEQGARLTFGSESLGGPTTRRPCSPTSRPATTSSGARCSGPCSRCRASRTRPRRSRWPTTPTTGRRRARASASTRRRSAPSRSSARRSRQRRAPRSAERS